MNTTNAAHAFLSASSAHRWLKCTAAPHFEAQFADSGSSSPYAQEGTLAHSFCELYAKRRFRPDQLSAQKLAASVKKLKAKELYNDEMIDCAKAYAEYLAGKAIELFDDPPYVTEEVRVDFSEYVPDGFGTCDCVMIGGDTIHITDYKHGKGVPVSATDNPQMMLYALGALKQFAPFYPNIKRVSMAIFQPRIREEASESVIPIEVLRAWGENVKPIAKTAYTGEGAYYTVGEHCKFCRGKAVCKARAEQNTALEEFKQFAVPTKAEPGANVLTNEQVGDLLQRGKDLLAWYEDLEAYATQALLEGEAVPGWKIVEGRSNRKIADTDKLVEVLTGEGYDEALLFERKPLSLTGYEKLVGKKRFTELAAGLIVKPQGAPTLVAESDKRAPFSSAATDFAGVSDND